MKEIKQEISGNNNVQIAGDYIVTPKHTTKVEVQYDPELYISDAEALQIREKVKEIGEILSKNSDKNVYQMIYRALYNKFDCSKYNLLPKDKFEEAMLFLSKYKGMNFGKGKLSDKQRIDRYKSIHAKFSELNISNEDMYKMINTYLSHKKYYNSLKELSDASLNKVYYYFMKMEK